MSVFSFLNTKLPIDTQKIEQAISSLEQRSSAELRVVVERKAVNQDAIMRAHQLFEELNIHKTAERNGVLLYLAFQPHLIAVIGDEAIHQHVGDAFWQSIYQMMKEDCQKQHYTEAICKAIEKITAQLVTHFPIQANDKNELANEVIIK